MKTAEQFFEENKERNYNYALKKIESIIDNNGDLFFYLDDYLRSETFVRIQNYLKDFGWKLEDCEFRWYQLSPLKTTYKTKRSLSFLKFWKNK